MTENERDDSDLRERFGAARRTESAWTPSFERVRTGRTRRARPRVRLVMVPALVAAAALVLWLGRPKVQETPEWLRITVGQLRTPTDFLLDVNGAENLRTIPSIGSSEGWFPLNEKSPKDDRL